MLAASLIIILGIWCTGTNSQYTLTQPAAQSFPLGQPGKISCSMSRDSQVGSYTIYWYQQKAGESPKYLLYDTSSSGRFTGSKDASANAAYLTVTNLQAEDEASYYCGGGYSSGSNLWINLTECGVSASISLSVPRKHGKTALHLGHINLPARGVSASISFSVPQKHGYQMPSEVEKGVLKLCAYELGLISKCFCMIITHCVIIFGDGTHLTVTGQPTVSPSVQVFAPSQEEIRSPNPHTVVCLVSGFYPPGFNLQWKCDDKVITSGVETTKATKQGDKYLASSYLKLNASDYEKYDTFTCQVTHESKTIVKSVSKSGSC
ncbi:uncharacterized protein LOC107292959 [Protobothrops mucrosquamatus]|uniref:uncharacterized protein LOC107292959 n=1 Tax=Protobothrops mucrosquamatus TaxID=103944 RepID=UPI0010FB76C1|nr:uncharacterized protein LOC107292959 [Protobothrops mucrosquamatus]